MSHYMVVAHSALVISLGGWGWHVSAFYQLFEMVISFALQVSSPTETAGTTFVVSALLFMD